ncbi:MAG: hypothetical protein M3125_06360, partial [Gemmatimonadota bacterium]|nr:hypothetical protein [Gemmatimonadota bacterium]
MSVRALRHLTLVTDQLQLELESAPASGEELLAKLRTLGLTGIHRCVLTQNRSVMISFRGGVLRLNRAYLGAASDVHRAIVTFVCGRTRHARREAQRIILEYPIPLDEMRPRREMAIRPHPGDVLLMQELTKWHD